MQLCGVLPTLNLKLTSSFSHQTNLSNTEAIASLSMPEAWVRGAMLVRCNSLLRGHSAVRLEVIRSLATLIRNDIVPLVPLRGSISASGDLSPLSYVAGTLEGNPDVYVWSGPPSKRVLLSADRALQSIGMNPIAFGPKEGLGLLNGTAFSAAVASLCHYDADKLALLAQILTAMSVDALQGNTGSFDPFIAAIRPHDGQIEAASNILSFLHGSKLVQTGHDYVHDGELRQDRYALRTSSQWLGPVLEDLSLAYQQIEVELNSTSDNPLVDTDSETIHHGGNFQASSITSSTEKTRLCLQKIGKIIFAQSSELLDNKLTHNLPPNLAADEPSLSYTMKGVDISMAAYYSELSWLANPVSNHVQVAEMANQVVNSLALVSARKTHDAVDVVGCMVAANLYCLCQALDLRAMNARFEDKLKLEVVKLSTGLLQDIGMSRETLEEFHGELWAQLLRALASTTSKDSDVRFDIVAQSLQHIFIDTLAFPRPQSPHMNSLDLIKTFTSNLASTCKSIFVSNRSAYLAKPDAAPCLGAASKKMYTFIRKELKVPMHRGLVDHSTFKGEGMEAGRERLTTGWQISRIYEALRNDSMTPVIMGCLVEGLEIGRKERKQRGGRL